MNANAPHPGDDAVATTIDNTIDRALSALRDAQPRSGLNSRILTNLERRAVTPQPSGFHISARLAFWSATSAAILAVASLLVLQHQTVRPSPVILSEVSHTDTNTNAVILSDPERAQRAEGESKNPDTARRVANAGPFFTTNLAQINHTPSSRPEDLSRHPERSALAQSRGTPVFENARTTEPPTEPSTTPTDAQALADLHAPSQPAPPLPLTPQEKLFRHALHYGNLTQLAELNPEVRARQDAAETAAFKAFFPEPPPVQQPGDTE